MQETRPGIWNCTKHGDPRIWENRHRKRSPIVKPQPVGGLPERLKQHIAPAENRYKLTPELKTYLMTCVDRGENPGRVADRIWSDLGYKNADAAKGSFYRALRTRN